MSPKHEPFSAQPTPLIGVLCKLSWLLPTSVLPDTNGIAGKLDTAGPSEAAAAGDVITTALFEALGEHANG